MAGGETAMARLAGIIAALIAMGGVGRLLKDMRHVTTGRVYREVVLHPATVLSLCFGSAYAASSSVSTSTMACAFGYALVSGIVDHDRQQKILRMDVIKRELQPDPADDVDDDACLEFD